jgi:hypothetical protein
MNSLPPELMSVIAEFRPLFRAEVFTHFCYLLMGLLLGEAKYGTAGASVFAPAGYWPQRLSDLFCRHRLSHQAFMAMLVEVVLAYLYPGGFPPRLFWSADSTLAEKPYARRVASLGLFHRTKRVVGRATPLKGHCYIFAAHLYEQLRQAPRQWASVLLGGLLYVKGRSLPALGAQLAGHLPLPTGVHHVWLGDRGPLTRPFIRGISTLGHFALGRVRCNQVVYFAPRRQARRARRPRLFGPKCRVDRLLTRFPQRLRSQTMSLRVRGRERTVLVYDTQVLLRGIWPGRALPARILLVVVPGLRLKPWYLLCTDLTLDPREAVRVYDGRFQIEVNFDEIKELGLGHYQGRSGQGVRRWPLFLCLAQTVLKFIATGILPIALPQLQWTWYPRQDTVGQARRRLIALCQPRISAAKQDPVIPQQLAKAA